MLSNLLEFCVFSVMLLLVLSSQHSQCMQNLPKSRIFPASGFPDFELFFYQIFKHCEVVVVTFFWFLKTWNFLSCNPVNLTLVILNFPANGDTKGAAAAAAASGMSRSVPSSPGDRKQGSIPIVGSAESLVGRVRNKNKVSRSMYFNLY